MATITFDDLIDIPADKLAKMSLGSLKRVLRRITSIANKKLEVLEITGLRGLSPATTTGYLMSHDRFVVPSSKSLQESRYLYRMATNFLRAQTSEYGNAREYVDRLMSNTNIVDEDQLRDYWAVVDAARELPDFVNLFMPGQSDPTFKVIANVYQPGKSIIDNFEAVKTELENKYSDIVKQQQPQDYVDPITEWKRFFNL